MLVLEKHHLAQVVKEPRRIRAKKADAQDTSEEVEEEKLECLHKSRNQVKGKAASLQNETQAQAMEAGQNGLALSRNNSSSALSIQSKSAPGGLGGFGGLNVSNGMASKGSKGTGAIGALGRSGSNSKHSTSLAVYKPK